MSGHIPQSVLNQFNSEHAAAHYARIHETPGQDRRFLCARIRLLCGLLAALPGGRLLDAGCGPGVLARIILNSHGHYFSITALDQSPQMVARCIASTQGKGELHGMVGDLMNLPFTAASFDVSLVTGVLEYVDARRAIAELSRVTKPGGVVIASMLNPMNPYRLVEWFVFWPALRVFSWTVKVFHIRMKRVYGKDRTGIHAITPRKMRRMMRSSGLAPRDLIYFDLTPLVPPLDRIPALQHWAERNSLRSSATRGVRRWQGTGYLIVAERA